ncbi:methyl-accepting chemotaxis protein [Saccharospirillum salsuginis]|uniref:Methyl-accepting chemotaxis protein n=1 Tax=Saccharospirillum salsuginis TaxID=418750 RepID=A0A918NF97_9GAMM|nr:methyl-accepting chemotaxis protein [Saccharospirillum salsuginis]GGX63066.1 methyl-accepting chemotaxis protein [Saccharospirillum salsuginis]
MKLSLISRVVAGFAALLIIFTAITLYSLFVEQKLADQLELASGQLGSLLDDTNRLRGRVQDANRAVTQHANAEDPDRRTTLAGTYERAKDDYRALAESLQARLEPYPELMELLNRQQSLAQSIFAASERHLALQNERIATRQQAVAQAQAFDNEWIFFEGDINAVASQAKSQGDSGLQWEVDFIVDQAEAAQAYLQRALAISNIERMAEVESQLEAIWGELKNKEAAIAENYPDYVDDMAPFFELFRQAIVAEDGLFQSHKHYVRLNEDSEALLLELDNRMDQSMATLNDIITATRAKTQAARESAESTAATAQSVTVGLLIVAIALSVLVGWSVAHSIRRPMNQTLAVLNRLAEGDLTERIQKVSHDEMGRIGTNVNALADRLTDVISQIRQSSETIAELAERASGVSRQTRERVEQQQEQTGSVATAITEMESAIHEVAGNAERTSSEVAQVTHEAQDNMASMDTNIQYTTELRDAQHKATGVIEALSEESQEIGTVLDVIQAIAEQTNLLALNAAIEAARAGEQGRGFAVVADEVRSLANRSQQSANDIREMIQRLREKASNAVDIMASNRSLAESSAEQSQRTGESLKTMVGSLGEINDMSHSIATASEEQSAVAREVTQNVVRISDMAEDLANIAREAAENSEQLTGLATDQRQLVGQFRLV